VVAKVEKPRVTKNPPRFLNCEDVDRLLETAQGYYIYPLLVTALHTGMRKSELLNLKWSDINFQHRTVTVQSKPDWHTKNYKSRTEIPQVYLTAARNVVRYKRIPLGFSFLLSSFLLKET